MSRRLAPKGDPVGDRVAEQAVERGVFPVESQCAALSIPAPGWSPACAAQDAGLSRDDFEENPGVAGNDLQQRFGRPGWLASALLPLLQGPWGDP